MVHHPGTTISLELNASQRSARDKIWCRREDLNPQPTDYKSVALPIELHRHKVVDDDGIEPPTPCL